MAVKRKWVLVGPTNARIARRVLATLERAGPGARDVLVDHARIGRWLLRHEAAVTLMVSPGRRRTKHLGAEVEATYDALPFAERSFDVACLTGLAEVSVATLGECARTVRDGGRVMVATRRRLWGPPVYPEALTATMVHAALVNVEQELLGTTWFTTATVRHWD